MLPHRRVPRLSHRDLTILRIERVWGPTASALPHKLAEAQRELGLSESAYALIVRSLLTDPAAIEADPETVLRLRRAHEQHKGVASTGPLHRAN